METKWTKIVYSTWPLSTRTNIIYLHIYIRKTIPLHSSWGYVLLSPNWAGSFSATRNCNISVWSMWLTQKVLFSNMCRTKEAKESGAPKHTYIFLFSHIEWFTGDAGLLQTDFQHDPTRHSILFKAFVSRLWWSSKREPYVVCGIYIYIEKSSSYRCGECFVRIF